MSGGPAASDRRDGEETEGERKRGLEGNEESKEGGKRREGENEEQG